ncbi:phage capsid protein, partial [Enterococcus faecium]|nr:phage capsid protein [Enterococcus faecium]
DFVDETGFISATRGRTLRNATYESLFMNALVLFPEIPAGVVEATIGENVDEIPVPVVGTITPTGDGATIELS